MIGHSAGGGDVQDAAQALKKKNIANVVTIQIDSVEPLGDDASIPSNVRKAINVYQTQTSGFMGRLVRGESNITAEDPNSTKIVNKEFTHTFKGIAPTTDPYAAHRNIDNDPKVQKFITYELNEVLDNPGLVQKEVSIETYPGLGLEVQY